MSESDLQILALAEEVERLQTALGDERAARDQLRRRFLKLSSPAAMAVASADQKRSTDENYSAKALGIKGESLVGGEEFQGSPVQHAVSPIRASVVDRVQLCAQQQLDQLSVQGSPQPVKQQGRRFSLWGFITGADKVIYVEDN